MKPAVIFPQFFLGHFCESEGPERRPDHVVRCFHASQCTRGEIGIFGEIVRREKALGSNRCNAGGKRSR